MSPEDFINQAIQIGQTSGIQALDSNQRMVWLISEAEVDCDKDGIESFLGRYAPDWLHDTSSAFSAVGAVDIAECLDLVSSSPSDSALLDRLNCLIASRVGYDFEAIEAEVRRRLTTGCS